MVRRCIAPGCNNTEFYPKDTKKRFHNFPNQKSRPQMFSIWMKIINPPKLPVFNQDCVCNDHFSRDCYCGSHGLRLRSCAFPNRLIRKRCVDDQAPSQFAESVHQITLQHLRDAPRRDAREMSQRSSSIIDVTANPHSSRIRFDVSRESLHTSSYGVDHAAENPHSSSYGLDDRGNPQNSSYGLDDSGNPQSSGIGLDVTENPHNSSYGLDAKRNPHDSSYGLDATENPHSFNWEVDPTRNLPSSSCGLDAGGSSQSSSLGHRSSQFLPISNIGPDASACSSGSGFDARTALHNSGTESDHRESSHSFSIELNASGSLHTSGIGLNPENFPFSLRLKELARKYSRESSVRVDTGIFPDTSSTGFHTSGISQSSVTEPQVPVVQRHSGPGFDTSGASHSSDTGFYTEQSPRRSASSKRLQKILPKLNIAPDKKIPPVHRKRKVSVSMC